MSRSERYEEAKNHLNVWLEAELKVASGQEFSMGSRRLKMPDLPFITERINYWRRQVSHFQPGVRKSLSHIVPIDL